MQKSMLAAAVLSLGFVAWQSTRSPGPAGQSFLDLEVARMTIEYKPSIDLATLVVKAESDQGLSSVEILDSRGRPILCMFGNDSRGSAVSDFQLDTPEVSAARLFLLFPEGPYAFRGLTQHGALALGSAELSHLLLAEPVVRYPFAGAAAVPTDLTIEWASDPQAAGYHVGVEQDDNDGLVAKLPAGSSSFKVPGGILRRGVETKLEVVAVAHNGNGTLAEISFTTR